MKVYNAFILLLSFVYSASLNLSINNRIINALTTYTFTLQRNNDNSISQLTIHTPNGTQTINYLTSQINVNEVSTTIFNNATGKVTLTSPTTNKIFTIIIQNTRNPSSVITLNASNTWITIDQETINLTNTISFSNGQPQSCKIVFLPSTNTSGISIISFNTTNAITTTNSYIIIEYPQNWQSSSKGFATNGSTITTNIAILNIKIFYHNGTNITISNANFGVLSTAINITLPAINLPPYSFIEITLNNINTPPYETQNDVYVTSASQFGIVDKPWKCQTKTTIQEYFATFDAKPLISTILNNPTAKTNQPISNHRITHNDKIVFQSQFVLFDGSFNLTLTNGANTIDCRNGQCRVNNPTTINQNYNINFVGNITVPSSSKPTYFNITFLSNNNNSYMKICILLTPTPRILTSTSISIDPKTVGSLSSVFLSFTTTNNQILSPIGISFTTPPSMSIQTDSSCSSTISDFTFVNSTYINSTTLICVFSFSGNIANKQINITINKVNNNPSTSPVYSMIVNTLLNSNNIQSVVQTANLSYLDFVVGSIIQSNIVCNNDSVNSLSSCSLQYHNIVELKQNTKIIIKIPSDMTFINNNVNLIIESNNRSLTGQISLSNITIITPIIITKNTTIKIQFSVINPPKTGITQSFAVYDISPDNYEISQIQNGLTVNILSAQWMSFNVYPFDATTGMLSNYEFVFIPTVNYPTNTVVTLRFETIKISSCSSNCSSCQFINQSSIKFTFNSLSASSPIFCQIQNIKNPKSFKPETILILSESSETKINQGVTKVAMSQANNIVLSDIKNINKQYMSDLPNNLTIQVTNNLKQNDYFIVNLDAGFYSQTTNVECSDQRFTCQKNGSLKLKVTIKQFLPNSFDFSFVGYQTGSVGFSGTIFIQSYDSQHYLIDRSNLLSFVQTCSNGCKTCNTFNLSFCLSCYSSGTPQIYLINNVCTNNCSSVNQFYYNFDDICRSCNTNCTSCRNQTSCTSCITNFYLYSDSSCRQTCPSSYYTTSGLLIGSQNNLIINNCLACSNQCKQCTGFSRNCITCTNSSLVFYIDSCIEQCPDGFYKTSTKCLQCDFSCSTCIGPSSFNCTFCRNDFIKTSSNQCVSTCPVGTAYNPSSSICQCAQGCLLCSDSIYNCSLCQINYSLYKNICYAQCPNGLYKTGTTCSECPNGCQLCEFGKCTKCLSTFLYNGLCYTDCKALGQRFYNNNINMTCDSCSIGCSICNQSNIQQCISCSTGFSKINNQCVNQSISLQCLSGYTLINGFCSQIQISSVVASSVALGGAAVVSTSVIIISKVMGLATSIPFSAMALTSPQQIISLIAQIGTGSSSSSKRLLLQGQSMKIGSICLIVALVLNYLLNAIHIWVFCKLIFTDSQFHQNKRRRINRIMDNVILAFATLTNFKLYQIVFGKLCNATIFKTKLSSVSKLFPLKILNGISLVTSLLIITGSIITIIETISRAQQTLSIISIVLSSLTLIWTLMSFMKDDNFFSSQSAVYSQSESSIKSGEIQFNTKSKMSKVKVSPLQQTEQNVFQMNSFEGDSPLEKRFKNQDRVYLDNPIEDSIQSIKPSIQNIQQQYPQIKKRSTQPIQVKIKPKTKLSNIETSKSLKNKQPIKQKQIKTAQKSPKNILIQSISKDIQQNDINDFLDIQQYNDKSQPKLQKSRKIHSQIKLRTSKHKKMSVNNIPKLQSMIKMQESISQIQKGDKPANLFSQQSDNSKLFEIKKAKNSFNIQTRFFSSQEIGQLQPDMEYNEISPSAFNIQNQRFSSKQIKQKPSLFSLKSFELKDLSKQ